MVHTTIYVLGSLLWGFRPICAFHPPISSCRSPTFFNAQDNNDDLGEGSPSYDVDKLKRLESLLGTETNDEYNNEQTLSLTRLLQTNDYLSSLPNPPPLSAIERERRNVEIRILRQLRTSDEPLFEIWNLWYGERGETAQRMLRETDQLLGDPNTWDECETRLLGLVGTYGLFFVEPVNRLATLYFLQGKFQDSYKLCRIVLTLKPWHFGALSGIVQVCIRKGDLKRARVWAEKGMPTLESSGAEVGSTRAEWVEEAVGTADEMLERLEEVTQEILGRPEDYYSEDFGDDDQGILGDDVGPDAWQ